MSWKTLRQEVYKVWDAHTKHGAIGLCSKEVHWRLYKVKQHSGKGWVWNNWPEAPEQRSMDGLVWYIQVSNIHRCTSSISHITKIGTQALSHAIWVIYEIFHNLQVRSKLWERLIYNLTQKSLLWHPWQTLLNQEWIKSTKLSLRYLLYVSVSWHLSENRTFLEALNTDDGLLPAPNVIVK